MKFVEAILSNNTTDDHCREFVTQGGLVPLLGILSLPNLPIDFPSSQSCQAVASVLKAILTLSHEPQVCYCVTPFVRFYREDYRNGHEQSNNDS